MTSKTESFHRSTPIEQNDGTPPNAERHTERPTLKAIASATLQRNGTRNDSGTARNEIAGSFRNNSSNSESFHRSTVWEWNDGTVSGTYTPYCLPVSIELVHELHRLIRAYGEQFRLAEAETAKYIETARRQALASVPESVRWFEDQLKGMQ